MGDMEIPDELIDRLLGEYEGPEQLTGPDGLINQLRKRLIERAAGCELEQHLGYPIGGEPPEGQINRRNGVSAKTLRTVDGSGANPMRFRSQSARLPTIRCRPQFLGAP
jgi:putative transposase